MDSNRRNPGTEYLLQGSVLDDSVDILLHRLKGMCDNSEEGLTRFEEHEIVYTMRGGPMPQSNIVSVRVRKQLNSPEKPYTLSYLGNPEIGDRNSLTTVRTCVEANCGQNVCTFLQELGFIVDFDYIKQGWLFRKNRIKATVSKVCRFTHSTNKDQLAPVSKSHLVEVSTISNSSNEQAATDVHHFSEMLKPLVSLEKIDSKRLCM